MHIPYINKLFFNSKKLCIVCMEFFHKHSYLCLVNVKVAYNRCNVERKYNNAVCTNNIFVNLSLSGFVLINIIYYFDHESTPKYLRDSHAHYNVIYCKKLGYCCMLRIAFVSMT